MTLPPRFWDLVDKSGECWLWKGFVRPDGYGQFARSTRVHRAAYEALVGPIPEGLELDHLCRVRNCLNPEHLEPVTRQINLLRGDTVAARHAVQTHCLRGHEYTVLNTLDQQGRGRRCRTCKNERRRKGAVL